MMRNLSRVLPMLATLLLTTWAGSLPPAQAAVATPPSICAAYQAIPHGLSTPATFMCLAQPQKTGPFETGGCTSGRLVIYQDANDSGDYLCFGPGNYNLTDFVFCLFWPVGCGSANDQLSSFRNNTASAGYMTTDINGGGSILWFSAYQNMAYVGATFNDRISFIHLN